MKPIKIQFLVMADKLKKEFAGIKRFTSDITGWTKLKEAAKKYGVTVVAVGAAFRTLKSVGSTALKGLGAAWHGLSSAMRGARNGALAFTGAMAVAVREGVKMNVRLAQATNMFGGNRLATFTKLRAAVLDISAETGIASDQIMESLYTAGSAQFSPDKALEAVRIAARGFVADGADIQDVMSGIIAGVKSFGGEIEETSEQLYKIVQLGQATFGEVGQYLSQVAPVASANKVTLAETGAGLAQLTSKTIPMSQAANMLRNMMARLNTELGDNWRQTYKFQDAMEMVAKKANYSQTALAKAFGMENLAGVNALVGSNFIESMNQLNQFSGNLTGLKDSAGFVDQFRGWEKMWQSTRAIVSGIGTDLEEKWSPVIQRLAAYVKDMRNGAAFKSITDKLTTALTDGAVKLMTGVQVALDAISKASLGGVLSASVGALVDLALSLLGAGLMSLKSIFVALAKIFSAAFAADFMKIDLPFRNEHKNAEDSVRKNITGGKYTDAQMESFGVPKELQHNKGGDPAAAIKNMKKMNAWLAWQDMDKLVDMATTSSDTDIGAALDKSKAEFAAIKDKLGDNMDNLLKNAGKRIGFDFKSAYQSKLPEVRDQMGLPSNDVDYELNKKAAVRDNKAEAQRKQDAVVQSPADLINSYLSSPSNTRSATEDEENRNRIAQAYENSLQIQTDILGDVASSMESFNERLKRLDAQRRQQLVRDRQF